MNYRFGTIFALISAIALLATPAAAAGRASAPVAKFTPLIAP